MIGNLLGGALARELRKLRRQALAAELIFAALLMAGLALGLVALGLHLWLSTLMRPWQAAFVAALAPAGAALGLWLAARRLTPPPPPPPPPPEDELAALARSILSGDGKDGVDAKGLAGLALAGLLIGLLTGGPRK